MLLLSLARRLERCCPPEQVVNHRLRLLLKLNESFVHVTALEMSPKSGYGNVDRRPYRSHLDLNCRLPELLDTTRAHRAAVAYEGSGLAIPFRINPIDCVLEHRRRAVVVFGSYENERVGRCDGGC